MKNNKSNSKLNSSSIVTRKAKAQNNGKISPATCNGFADNSLKKKVKKEGKVQQSDTDSNLSNCTNNSENIQTSSEQFSVNNETLKISIEQRNNDIIIEKTEDIIDLSDPYNLLLQAAQDPDSISNSSEINQRLMDIKKFNQQNDTIVFLENTFAGQQTSISPLIFTRTNLQIKHNYSKSQEIIAFENYLNFVTWLYYKKKYKLNEQLINFDEGSYEKVKDSKLKLHEKKKKSKIQGKTKNNSNANQQAEELTDPQSMEAEQEFHQDILESLITPLRPTLPFGFFFNFLTNFNQENWSPKEIAIFETGICKFGKNFGFIQQLIQSKTQTEVNEFYQQWKLTYHYKVWKHYKNMANRNNYNNISLQYIQFV